MICNLVLVCRQCRYDIEVQASFLKWKLLSFGILHTSHLGSHMRVSPGLNMKCDICALFYLSAPPWGEMVVVKLHTPLPLLFVSLLKENYYYIFNEL
jgi:hypothetical protein